MIHAKDYEKVAGKDVVARLRKKAATLRGKHVVMVSSTHQGGGVAEILNTLVLLLNDLGVDCGWRIIHGDPDFFSVTKKMHNLLQGGRGSLTRAEKARYVETNERYCRFTHLHHHDIVVVHDPQPLPLIACERHAHQKWIWRCHIDLSAPNKKAWAVARPYVKQYDRVVVSHERFGKAVGRACDVIHPAIDPLSVKNKPLSPSVARKLLKGVGIDPSVPFIAQVSRYDTWKDPEGVIRVFDRVKKKADCRLVLLGNTASDDPEGVELYRRLKEKYGRRNDIHLLVNVEDNDRVVNAVQSQAAVVLQKSIREGFALTVAEALWKGTPVVASRVGGIPLQVKDSANGFLLDSDDEAGFAARLLRLLNDAKMRAAFGRAARQTVTEGFLMTRLAEDWLDLFGTLLDQKRNPRRT